MSQIQLVILRRWKATYPLESQYLSIDPNYLKRPPFSSISEAILWRSRMLLLIRSSFCAITSSPFRRFPSILESSGRFFVFLPDTCSWYNFTSPASATAFHWAARFWAWYILLLISSAFLLITFLISFVTKKTSYRELCQLRVFLAVFFDKPVFWFIYFSCAHVFYSFPIGSLSSIFLLHYRLSS